MTLRLADGTMCYTPHPASASCSARVPLILQLGTPALAAAPLLHTHCRPLCPCLSQLTLLHIPSQQTHTMASMLVVARAAARPVQVGAALLFEDACAYLLMRSMTLRLCPLPPPCRPHGAAAGLRPGQPSARLPAPCTSTPVSRSSQRPQRCGQAAGIHAAVLPLPLLRCRRRCPRRLSRRTPLPACFMLPFAALCCTACSTLDAD